MCALVGLLLVLFRKLVLIYSLFCFKFFIMKFQSRENRVLKPPCTHHSPSIVINSWPILFYLFYHESPPSFREYFEESQTLQTVKSIFLNAQRKYKHNSNSKANHRIKITQDEQPSKNICSYNTKKTKQTNQKHSELEKKMGRISKENNIMV